MQPRFLLAVVAIACLFHSAWAIPTYVLTLDSSNTAWTVRNLNNSIRCGATVPGGIYSDLERAKVLESVLYRYNDVQYRWVANDSWIYETYFDVSRTLLGSKQKFLVFHGLHTVAKIYLNKVLIGSTDNMFVRYRIDVKDQLKENNKLEIFFESPIKAAKAAHMKSKYPIQPTCPPPTYNGECHANMLRMKQDSFGWDWGPAIPSLGIWKSIDLELYNSAVIREVTTHLEKSTNFWTLKVQIFLESSLKVTGQLSAVLYTKNKSIYKTVNWENEGYANTTIELEVPYDEVDLWWPNGYGDHPLYKLLVTFESGGEKFVNTKNIGFRTIVLMQDRIDRLSIEKGLTFYFLVNGVPIFAKGSNVIPRSVFPEEDENSRKYAEYLLQSAADVHMNMIRVWGGGIYESDYFYELCDRLGILIWQDLMFACSMYPADSDFLSSVAVEVDQQVKRLQHHPSIAIWAGNNENEAALVQNWYNTSTNERQYRADYVKLYVDTIMPIMKRVDPNRMYVTSSPSNGLETLMENYLSKDPQSSLYGDRHYYDYYKNSWLSYNYPPARFSSEYGFQSMPSKSNLEQASGANDSLVMGEKFLEHRQHLPGGYLFMFNLIHHNVKMSLKRCCKLEEFIYLSQLNQAWSLKIETENYRQGRGIITPSGEGHTMGALYWQLNDVWVAPSWSSIEYGGKWKMAHYYAKHFFAPILISARQMKSGTISMYVTSDLLTDIPSCEIIVDVHTWDSFARETSHVISNYTVKNATSELVESFTLKSLINKSTPAKISGNENVTEEKDRFSPVYFLHLQLYDAAGTLLSQNFILPQGFLNITGFETANVTIHHVQSIDVKKFTIHLQTNRLAAFVWLETTIPGRFSDNGFMMIEPTMQLNFTADAEIDSEDLQNNLSVMRLKEDY
ncbi:unnamed protein product [Bemisia tabaci]|uniref:Beta-mannosidase B n=1 Tax=Bemisia tabaci TaxID=7038 RepID=A0A9P0A7Z8_BEMTA|nr:unnamed protein product [Bemisia tabaci]